MNIFYIYRGKIWLCKEVERCYNWSAKGDREKLSFIFLRFNKYCYFKKKKIEDSKYEYCINVLNVFIKHQVGQKLGKFDVEKRRAIELEDFDTAKKKKVRFFFLFYT